MPNVRKHPHPTAGGGLPKVTPVEIDRVRRSVLDIVRKNMPEVRKVLAGDISWGNSQVRLFTVCLNKVMPDLHHSFNQHSVENKELHELTEQELQQIILRAETASAEDAEESSDDHTSDDGWKKPELQED